MLITCNCLLQLDASHCTHGGHTFYLMMYIDVQLSKVPLYTVLWHKLAFYMEMWVNCTVWVKKNPPPLRGPDISRFSHKRLRIFNRFFKHPLHVLICARLQIFIQLSPILTKLCHIKRDYPVHIICSKCPPSVETHALTRLRKSLIALLIIVCGK